MKRFIIYIAGLNLIAAAVVLNIRYDLGVAAFSSVMYAVAEIYHISIGAATIICYLIFVSMQCVLSKRITLTYALEIPLSFAFGLLTDFYDFLIPDFSLALVPGALCFFLTMFVTALGVFLCVKSRLILTPVEGIVQTISDVFKFPFSMVKNVCDVSLVAISALLCIAYGAPFYGIGAGTVLSAFAIGRIIKIYERADASLRLGAGTH
ncbi:DUF6198 family protein [uncultured Cloacibacillus sp.]|uniref:YczE/YyaS/YitT family protein n=1 Tax=uncultured Cloacibacillus sp. TaxID=889794 RepID=UPI00320B7217